MQKMATLFRALADPSRLRIIHLLFSSGELCVCDLESVLGITQTKVSRHLGYLRRTGLIKARKQGLWMLYSIVPSLTKEQRDVLDCARKLMEGNEKTIRDKQRLVSNIRRGCCATFSNVKFGQIPASLQ
ncbi:MAG TPA: metalloregulator ArsR/SmtB family transcription factor [Bacteroidota bacterium]|jgi:ArsR family transcriptional regulator